MAKFCTTTIIVFSLFCLLTLTLAANLPENDESTTQGSVPISETANEKLRLPKEPVYTETISNSAVESSVPLTKITFRPVNRRFGVRSKRPCRHHFRFYPAMRGNVEVPYGNDMLVSSGENSDFQEPILHGEGRRIRPRWVRMHHHHHHGVGISEDDDRLKKMVFKQYENRFDWEKKLKKLRKRLHSEEEEKKSGGLMKRVRKFLDHYF